MPIGLPEYPDLLPVSGVQLGTANAGIKAKTGDDDSAPRRDDLALVQCVPTTVAAAVFTSNRFCAAPVIVARQHLGQTRTRTLIINSGNANAGTGIKGEQDADLVCGLAAEAMGVSKSAVLPFSTGVIGTRLPVEKIREALPRCTETMSEDNWLAAARAIMTTDIVPKGVSRRFELGGTPVTVTGIAKGSGMICPDMATMLGFIATDAVVSKPLLDAILHTAVRESFNRISVDGDTSTNDACALLATGCADMDIIDDEQDRRYPVLQENLERVCISLAQSLIRDGEGATKFVTVEVNGADSDQDAKELALAIAHSPLVKTALFASDPNWGRILAVIGRAPIARLDIARVSICINDVEIVNGGELSSTYSEEAGQRAMEPDEVHIKIWLGTGDAGVTVWTNDLSYDYIKINAEYRS